MLLRGSGLRALLVCTREAAFLRARAQTNTFAFMDSNRKAAALFCALVLPCAMGSSLSRSVTSPCGERLSVPSMCWHMWCWGGAMTPHTLGNTLLLNCTPGQILTSLAFIP